MAKRRVVSSYSPGEGAFGIVSFVFGILSIVFSLISPLVAVFFAIVGFIFWFFQRRRQTTRIMRAAFILNLIGLVLSIVIATIVALYLNSHPEILAQIQQAVQTP